MKRIILGLVVIGLAVSSLGCSQNAGSDDASYVGDYDISGSLTGALTSGSGSYTDSGVEYSATIENVTVTVYSDSSYANSVKSATVDTSAYVPTTALTYSLTDLAAGTYYAKASQEITYSVAGLGITVANSGTKTVTIGSSDATDQDITLSTP
ncbi:hypothetical protein ACFL5U_03025 [Candidatus Margulisiibacteriota bacterium]